MYFYTSCSELPTDGCAVGAYLVGGTRLVDITVARSSVAPVGALLDIFRVSRRCKLVAARYTHTPATQSYPKIKVLKKKITMKFLTLPLLLVSLPLSRAETTFSVDSVSCVGGPYLVTSLEVTCGNNLCTWGSTALLEGLGKLATARIHSFPGMLFQTAGYSMLPPLLLQSPFSQI